LPGILEKNPELRYVIIGQGPEEAAITQMINDHALQGKVILLNKVTDEEKWAWLETADIFIMPAKELPGGDYEGFGIVYLEANLFGKPVIAGRSGGVSDAVTDGVNGLLVNPENLGEISEAIVRLANDSELRARLGSQGKERVLTDFAWPDKVKEMYQALVSKL
jgi:phosphatidylinositol alpha-1,6-mannosyltransferase